MKAVGSCGSSDSDALVAALTTAGLAVVDDDADIDLVIADDYLQPALGEVNLRALDEGRPWMLVRASSAADKQARST